MKEYSVAVPILGTAIVMVEAGSAAEAIKKAVYEAGPDHVDEWLAYDKLVEGNFYHGQISKARIDEVYDPEAEEDEDGSAD